jgi:hypothetical protein
VQLQQLLQCTQQLQSELQQERATCVAQLEALKAQAGQQVAQYKLLYQQEFARRRKLHDQVGGRDFVAGWMEGVWRGLAEVVSVFCCVHVGLVCGAWGACAVVAARAGWAACTCCSGLIGGWAACTCCSAKAS